MPVYKSDNGKWYCSFYYTTADGIRKRKKKEGFSTKREASEFEREFIAKSNSSTDMPFAEMCNLYFEDLKARVRQSSFRTAYSEISNSVLPYFSRYKMSEITPVVVRRWQTTLLNSGRSDNYIRIVNSRLNSIFIFAQKYYNLSDNPMNRTGSIGSSKTREMDFWTQDEFVRFMETVNQPDLACAFYILFYTGLRCGELLALTVGDLDFGKNEISINKTLVKVNGQIVINPPKTPESKRIVTVPSKVMRIISDYLAQLYKPEANDRLFSELTTSKLRTAMINGSDAAGVKFIRIHDLRHSHASWLIENGYPIQVVSERLGHSNTQMTLNVYAHLYPNKQTELAKELDDLIIEAVPKTPKK